MTTIATTILDMPLSLREKFGDTIPFSLIEGIYWDGMDWCNKYDEVLPTKQDKVLLNESYGAEDFIDARTFL